MTGLPLEVLDLLFKILAKPFFSKLFNMRFAFLIVTLSFVEISCVVNSNESKDVPRGIGLLSSSIPLGGFILAIVSLYVFVKLENKATEPIIPMYLFKNKNYNTLLIVGILTYFYMSPMNVYAPLSVQQVLNASATVSDALQLPRTILTIIFPAIIGMWVGKNDGNLWKVMACYLSLVVISFIPLSFTSSTTPVIIYFVAIALTGLAESFRAVSVTPAAQSTLESKDLGVGTSLVTFMNSLSGLFSVTISGVIFDASSNMTKAINSIFAINSVVSLIGVFIVLFVVRKNLHKKEKLYS